MPFSAKIQELSKQLEECKDDAEASRLAHELHSLIHDQIQLVRQKIALGYPIKPRSEDSSSS
jgi:hypothetical protein